MHDAAPLASTDLISIGVVMLQFVEPESQAIEETLPFPLAFALRQVDTAGSSERRLRAAQLGIELVLRFVFAAQVGALLPVEAGALVRRLLRGLQFNRAVSMGAWVELVCRLAPAFEQDPGPLGVALRALVQGAGGAGALQQRITRQVELRNDLSHRWFGEEDAYENEAQQAVGELRTLVQALVPLRATTLFGWLPSDGGPNPATQQGWPVRVMRGASLQFPLRSLPLMQPLEAGWCYLVDDRQRVLPLAPFFALLTSQQTRRLDLFISRTFPLLAAGAPTQVDGLTCGHGAEVPFPTSPLLRSLMG